MKPIQLFEPLYRTDECLAELRPWLDAGWTAPGELTQRLERAWGQYTGLPHSLFTNSCTAALHLALTVLRIRRGWQDGDEVISTPLTFVSTNHAILYAGLRPVFADIDEYLCLDPQSVRERITPRTRAVMFVGVGGNTGQLAAIEDLCREHQLTLVIDAAHMAGTRFVQKLPGRLTHVGVELGGSAAALAYSFQGVKNLPAGDGGMLCMREPEEMSLARQLSWMGIDRDTYARTLDPDAKYKWKYMVPHLGFKAHGNALNAALALVGLRYLDQDNAMRSLIAERYEQRLGTYSVPVAARCSSSRHLYQLRVPERDRLITRLNDRQIYPGVHYASNQDYPLYGQQQPTPASQKAAKELLSLPMHVKLTDDDVERVITAVEAEL